MFGRVHGVDHMTLDQIDEALDHYAKTPAGKITPSDADRVRELRYAKQRITGRDRNYSWWR